MLRFAVNYTKVVIEMVRLSVENIGQDAMDYNLAKAGYTTFYVDGTDGLDTYPGDSWGQPFKTIQHAVDVAESWANIFIKAGTYAENVIIATDSISLIGQSRDAVEIHPASGDALNISGDFVTVTKLSLYAHDCCARLSGKYLTLDTIKLDGVDMSVGLFLVVPNHATITNIYVSTTHLMYAIETMGAASYLEISNCIFDLSYASSNVYVIYLDKILKSKIFNNDIKALNGGASYGMWITPTCSDLSIFHNNFINNTIQIYDAGGTRISAFENFYGDHTNVDNGFGIAKAPYAYAGGTDPRPVCVRDGWDGLSWADADLVADILTVMRGTDNAFSSAISQDYTTEKTVFEIASDTRYEIIGAWIDITPFTAADTITFQFYRAIDAAGVTYRKAGAAISKVKDTDNPIVEFADFAHYGYTKITAISSPGRTVVVPYGYIKESME